jgi:hypothetical protein
MMSKSCITSIGWPVYGVITVLMAGASLGCDGSSVWKEPAVEEGVCEVSANSGASVEANQSSEDGGTTDVGENELNEDGGVAGGATAVEYLERIGCTSDFGALASAPMATTLPGARSAKVVLDTADNNHLYFQNSVLYPLHYDFTSTHVSGNGLPEVSPRGEFETTEYYSSSRRFILGAVTHYEGPKKWVFEIAPYDTASAEMVTTAYKAIQGKAFFGPALYFHPTSVAVQKMAQDLPSNVHVITTDDLYASIDYQPLTLATGVGRLRFIKSKDLDTAYPSYQDILVLDSTPNDISVVQGIISQEFQTPLSHVNVLSQNRHTPNMGLRGAWTNKTLRAHEGKFVKLTVGALKWELEAVADDEAQAFIDAHKPSAVTLPDMNLEVTDFLDIEDVTPEPTGDQTLRDVIKDAVNAWGGKAAQYSVLAKTTDVPVRKAFAIPIYWYDLFMKQNGFYDRIDALRQDNTFNTDSAYRDQKLKEFRDDMVAAPVDEEFQELLEAKVNPDYLGARLRFRTSTNSEDLEAFPCAGCYESHSGDPVEMENMLDAIRTAYSSAWLFRTYEEREYYGVDHKSVGMALLVHHNFPEEGANGVAITSNPFDAAGVDPAFYVNVQYGGNVEVVHPLTGVSTDQFLLYFNEPGQPVTYLAHSNLIGEDEAVLTPTQIHSLGEALNAIHERFSAAYGPAADNTGWYAMDVEFKFDNEEDPSQPPWLYIKQARPYPKSETGQ